MELKLTDVALLFALALPVTIILTTGVTANDGGQASETTQDGISGMSLESISEGISYCDNSTLNNCSSNANCTDQDNGFICTCGEGFVGDGVTCNVNPCNNATLNNCSTDATCNVTENSFTCTCNEGYAGDGVTCYVNECYNSTWNNCSVNADCTDSDDGFSCACKTGYEGDGILCEDIDECSNSSLYNCTEFSSCNNTVGGYDCVCDVGFHGDGKVACNNTDECASGTATGCDANAYCNDTIGNYTCTCNDGFVGDGYNCTDIDECSNSSLYNCTEFSSCNNTVGGYDCVCDVGFHGDGKVACNNTDECASGTATECDANAYCNDTIGNYTCTCHDGFVGDGYNCTDIDECKNSTLNDCDEDNGLCANTVGGYNCSCVSGFNINGTACENIDECADNSLHQCDKNANCTDTIGNYTCACISGYEGNGYTCKDINECSKNSSCHEYAACQNTDGSYNCTCFQGFHGDGTECENIDECANVTLNNCHQNADCNDTIGSYNCSCKPGYAGDGYSCKDVDECQGSPCENSGFCQNEYGSFKCFCSKHWTGQNCSQDVDECLESSLNDCSDFASCMSSGENYNCTCKDGYKGDGKRCTRILLLEYEEGHQENSDDKLYGPFSFPFAFPYFDKKYYSAYVSTNGYITLGEEYEEKYFLNANSIPDGKTVIAPLWADIDFTTLPPNQGVFVQQIDLTKSSENSVDENLIHSMLENVTENYKAAYLLVVTWRKAPPYPSEEFGWRETASFQAILSTDGQKSYLMFNYDRDDMKWTTPGTAQAVVGYSNSSFVIVAENTKEAMNLTENSNIDIPGRWLFPVASLPTHDKTFKCHQFLVSNSTSGKDNESYELNSACPCSKEQAELDLRYMRAFEFNMSDGECFKPRYVPNTSTGKTICCYDRVVANLRTDVPAGGFFVSKEQETLIQGAWEDCCGSDLDMCFKFYEVLPSTSCEQYNYPDSFFGWGDPHIQRLGWREYTLNGWGEYILMKTDSGNFEVQARTNRIESRNVTVFDAFALQEGSGDVLEVNINHASDSMNTYINGIETLSEMEFNGGFITFSTDGNTVKIILVSNILLEIIFTDNRLAIRLSVPDSFKGKMTGVLGTYPASKPDEFKYRNGTKLRSSPPEAEFFDFINTWSLFNESESLFNYSLSEAKSFSSYQHPDFIPRFYQDEFFENATALFGNLSLLENAQNLCSMVLPCLMDLVATGDEALVNTTRDQYLDKVRTESFMGSKPPEFIFSQDFIQVTVGERAYFKLNVTDSNNSTVEISVDTSIQNYSLEKENMQVSFDFLLNTTERVYFKVIANNSMSMSSVFWLEIRLCSCVHGQCDYNPSVIHNINKDKFLLLSCTCDEGKTGPECNKTLNVCENNMCYPGVTCNISNGDKPCSSCPDGLEGDGIKCYDKNECYDNNGTCGVNSVCVNTQGKYYCQCNKGFVKSKVPNSCEDKNECSQKNICGIDKYCTNTIGSYDCKCRPSSYFSSSSDTCKKAQYTYGGVLKILAMLQFNQGWNNALLDPQTDEFKSFAMKISEVLKIVFKDSADSLLAAVVNSFREKNADRRKRDTSTPSVIEADYSLYYNTPMSETDLQNKLDASFKSCSGQYCVLGDGSTQIMGVDKQSIITDDKDLCANPNDNNCDTTSTNCTSSNGTFSCYCKTGYEGWDLSVGGNVCQDVDECSTEARRDFFCGTVAKCVNSPGSYECTCPHGSVFTDKDCKDVCDGNPCQNGGECIKEESSHKCKCTEGWTGFSCETEDPKVKSLTKILIGVGAGVGSLCLILILALICCGRKRQNAYNKHPVSDMDEWSGIPRPQIRRSPDEHSVEMAENGSRDKFSILSDDYQATSLKEYNGSSQPVTSFNKHASAEAYENPAYTNNETLKYKL